MTVNKPNSEGGYDGSVNAYIEIRHPPADLVGLRTELVYHKEISEYANQGSTFEECLARIGGRLDIVLDGDYDPSKLCGMLTKALRQRRFFPDRTIQLKELIAVEIVETEGAISLVEQSSLPLLLPEGAVVVEKPSHVLAISKDSGMDEVSLDGEGGGPSLDFGESDSKYGDTPESICEQAEGDNGTTGTDDTGSESSGQSTGEAGQAGNVSQGGSTDTVSVDAEEKRRNFELANWKI